MGNEKIVPHQGPLSKEHPSYKGSKYNVRVEWENGEITEEPLSVIAVDAPVACVHFWTSQNGGDSREFPSNKENCSLRQTRQRLGTTSISQNSSMGSRYLEITKRISD